MSDLVSLAQESLRIAQAAGVFIQGDTDDHPEGDSDCLYDQEGNEVAGPFASLADPRFIAHARIALEASAQAVITLAERVEEVTSFNVMLKEKNNALGARVAELERQLVDAKNRLNRELEVAKRHGM